MELASRFPAPGRRCTQQQDAEESESNNDAAASRSGGHDRDTSDGLEPPAVDWAGCDDSVDWEAVRNASHEALSDAIKCRGMQFRWGGGCNASL
jgi:hypothetical protein